MLQRKQVTRLIRNEFVQVDEAIKEYAYILL